MKITYFPILSATIKRTVFQGNPKETIYALYTEVSSNIHQARCDDKIQDIDIAVYSLICKNSDMLTLNPNGIRVMYRFTARQLVESLESNLDDNGRPIFSMETIKQSLKRLLQVDIIEIYRN